MGQFIQNVPIACIYCGYSPVPGQEYKTKINEGTLVECSWKCPRCGNLVRRDEIVIKDEPKQ